MGYPTIIVEIAFNDTPFVGTPDFTDGNVANFVRDRISIRRGRTDEFAEMRAGTATLTLLNFYRRFDPENATGPLYGALVPMKQIRIRAEWDGTTHYLFSGFIVSWTMRYDNGGIAYADLACVDGFEPLSRLQLGTVDTPLVLAASDGQDRANDVLDAVGWPAAKREIDPGLDFLLQESTLDGVPALEYLQLVARSEDGTFFIGKEGNAVMQGRLWRSVTSPFGTAWGDDDSELPYLDFRTTYSADLIYNRAEVMREGGTLQVDNDVPSQTDYLTRTVSRIGLLLDDDADALTIAEGIVDAYNDPKVRARSLRPQPHIGDTWAEILGREISDRITVRRATLLGGTPTEMDAFIEGIAIDLYRTPDEWTWSFEWSLSSL